MVSNLAETLSANAIYNAPKIVGGRV